MKDQISQTIIDILRTSKSDITIPLIDYIRLMENSAQLKSMKESDVIVIDTHDAYSIARVYVNDLAVDRVKSAIKEALDDYYESESDQWKQQKIKEHKEPGETWLAKWLHKT